jgi:hypothetical protein
MATTSPNNYDVRDLLAHGRAIWGSDGEDKLTLSEIVIRLGVGFGDLCRMARGADKDPRDGHELMKELGNVIFSVIRWCDDLGFDPVACVELAMEAQRKFAAANRRR